MRRSVGLVLCSALALSGAVACVNTTTSERNVGLPERRVHEDLLPGPAELEAVLVGRDESELTLELSRVRWCRRQEISTQQREKVEVSKVSLGTGIGSAVVMSLGVVSMSAALFVVGGGMLGIAAIQTGTVTKPLPEESTLGPAKREICRRSAAPGVVVQVLLDDAEQQVTSDPRGVLTVSGATGGKLRLRVDGEPIRLRKGQPEERPLASADAEAPPRPSRPKPVAPPPPPKPVPPKPPTGALPLPPPPPPPPGVRLLPE